MDDQPLLITRRDGVVELTLNRPQVLNAFNASLLRALLAAFAECAADDEVRAVLLTGAGRCFCAGADLSPGAFADEPIPRGAKRPDNIRTYYNPLATAAASLPKPLIVAVNGVAAGGGASLALMGDVVLAARSASFVQVFGPKLGIMPDVGGTWILPRIVGRARARGMTLLGERITAERAAEWGMIWSVCEDEALLETAREIAERLAAGPTNAFAAIKRALDVSLHNQLATQLELEAIQQETLTDHPNFAEGVRAFRDKRPPNFRG